MEWRVKILWNPKMFIIFVSTKGSFPLKEISCQRAQNEAFSIMPSAAEIAVRKYFECVSNDFRDRFCPVGKSSHKTALFYLMRYYFLPQQYSSLLSSFLPLRSTTMEITGNVPSFLSLSTQKILLSIRYDRDKP